MLDVVIVGAGISGIGCGCYLTRDMPGKRFRIIEARDNIGGTWDLFKYPGIRSDSDLYTFAYEFKPWKGDTAIAPADAILTYLREAVEEFGLSDKIDFGQRIEAASWSSGEALWTLTVKDLATGQTKAQKCRWVFMSSGYYDYERGFKPDFPNEDAFEGQVIHPQFWPDDLDLTGKTVALIGSGATAVTLLPELVQTAAHVTQIQRTPSYVMSLPARDGLAKAFEKWLPDQTAHTWSRHKNIWFSHYFVRFCQSFPDRAKRMIRKATAKQLPPGFPVETHFDPPYNPWDQRLCLAPNGDYFKALSQDNATIVTGGIDAFSANGIRMKDGTQIDADVVISATGLIVKIAGGIALSVDGRRIDPADHVVFRGALLDGVPNLSLAVGCTTSSWTLKIGLLCKYFMRLMRETEAQGKAICVAERPFGPFPTRPLMDFGAGYVKRALDYLPKQGAKEPWAMSFGYVPDSKLLSKVPIPEPGMSLLPKGAKIKSVDPDV